MIDSKVGRIPNHAQDIYREAFNHAYAAHANDDRQEEAAHRIAWSSIETTFI
ncbi:MAG: ChaB family protein [Roseiarcus sp.]